MKMKQIPVGVRISASNLESMLSILIVLNRSFFESTEFSKW